MTALGNDHQTITAGDFGVAQSGHGERSRAFAGKYGLAVAGRYGYATAGDYGHAVVGLYGRATAGDYGVARAEAGGTAVAGKHGYVSIDTYGRVRVGDGGVICVRYTPPGASSQSAMVVRVGEHGTRPNVLYDVTYDQQFVEVVEPTRQY